MTFPYVKVHSVNNKDYLFVTYKTSTGVLGVRIYDSDGSPLQDSSSNDLIDESYVDLSGALSQTEDFTFQNAIAVTDESVYVLVTGFYRTSSSNPFQSTSCGILKYDYQISKNNNSLTKVGQIFYDFGANSGSGVSSSRVQNLSSPSDQSHHCSDIFVTQDSTGADETLVLVSSFNVTPTRPIQSEFYVATFDANTLLFQNKADYAGLSTSSNDPGSSVRLGLFPHSCDPQNGWVFARLLCDWCD